MGIGGFGPPGAPRGPHGPPMGLRAQFGLVSDPGGLANDVSKAKNLIQIFLERMLVFLSRGLLSMWLQYIKLHLNFKLITFRKVY